MTQGDLKAISEQITAYQDGLFIKDGNWYCRALTAQKYKRMMIAALRAEQTRRENIASDLERQRIAKAETEARALKHARFLIQHQQAKTSTETKHQEKLARIAAANENEREGLRLFKRVAKDLLEPEVYLRLWAEVERREQENAAPKNVTE